MVLYKNLTILSMLKLLFPFNTTKIFKSRLLDWPLDCYRLLFSNNPLLNFIQILFIKPILNSVMMSNFFLRLNLVYSIELLLHNLLLFLSVIFIRFSIYLLLFRNFFLCFTLNNIKFT